MFDIHGIAFFANRGIYPLWLWNVWDDKTTTVNQTERKKDILLAVIKSQST